MVHSQVFYRVFFAAFYAVLRGYQTQRVFCKVISRVLHMAFFLRPIEGILYSVFLLGAL